MNQLNEFNITITSTNDVHQVIYELGEYSGTCTYKEIINPSKYQSNIIFLLTNSDMGDVLEYIHKKSPLSPTKFNEIQMGIRNHSLNKLTNHFNLK